MSVNRALAAGLRTSAARRGHCPGRRPVGVWRRRLGSVWPNQDESMSSDAATAGCSSSAGSGSRQSVEVAAGGKVRLQGADQVAARCASWASSGPSIALTRRRCRPGPAGRTATGRSRAPSRRRPHPGDRGRAARTRSGAPPGRRPGWVGCRRRQAPPGPSPSPLSPYVRFRSGQQSLSYLVETARLR